MKKDKKTEVSKAGSVFHGDDEDQAKVGDIDRKEEDGSTEAKLDKPIDLDKKTPNESSSSQKGQKVQIRNDIPLNTDDHQKPSASKVESEISNVETVKESALAGTKILTVQDIIDALSIILHSSKNISGGKSFDFISLSDMRVEMPKEVTKLDAELFFQGDKQGRWCIMYNKIRFDNAPGDVVVDYSNLVKHLHHVLEGTAK